MMIAEMSDPHHGSRILVISRRLSRLLFLASFPLLLSVSSGACADEAAPVTDEAESSVEHANALLQAGREREAAELMRQAVRAAQERLVAETAVGHASEEERAGQLSRWHTQQAQAALKGRSFLQALSHAERALELDPANRQANRVFDQAQRAFGEQKERLAKKIHFVAQAVEAEREGQYARALTLWRRAKTFDPKDAQIQQAIRAVQQKRRASRPTASRAADLYPVAQQKPISNEYILSPGDVLEVFIWQQQDLSRDIIVRPDGRISFPLVGDLDAAGMSLTKLDQVLTERLKTYLRFPDVSLAIRRFGGTKTIILGEVERPGVYVPAGEGRVLEVLAMAGGFTHDAVQESVMLIRGGLTSPKVAKLNLARALQQGALEENALLQPDDILYVPKTRVVSALDFMEQFYPTISEMLVGQNVATGFGTDVRLLKSDRPRAK